MTKIGTRVFQVIFVHSELYLCILIYSEIYLYNLFV